MPATRTNKHDIDTRLSLTITRLLSADPGLSPPAVPVGTSLCSTALPEMGAAATGCTGDLDPAWLGLRVTSALGLDRQDTLPAVFAAVDVQGIPSGPRKGSNLVNDIALRVR